MKKQIVAAGLTFLMLWQLSGVFGQVGVNTDGSEPHPSAMLDIKSADKGFLPPRVELNSLDESSPIQSPVAIGLLVYNTISRGTPPNNVVPGYYFWNGSRWVAVVLPQGYNPGELLVWNGATWMPMPNGVHGQKLFFCNGMPSWGGCFAELIAAPVTDITATSAVCGGNVISDGGTPVTARGVCWDTLPDPTTASGVCWSGTGIGPFVCQITGLKPGTKYYVRAFATNEAGTAYAYGIDSAFTTQPLTDAPFTFLSQFMACPGELVQVPVRVKNFNYIGSLALTLNYNPLSLVFSSSSNNAGFPGLVIDGQTPGTVLIDGTSANPVSYADSTILFTLFFTYTGGLADLTWVDNGASCEYRTADLVLLNDEPIGSFYQHGQISPVAAVTEPVFAIGPVSERCQGAGTITYTATASNSTGIYYSLDAASVAAGNTIDPVSGMVIFVAGWSGQSVITATASGCGGPKHSDHTVTVTPNAVVDVDITASASLVCEGTPVTFTATVQNGGANPVYQWKVNGVDAGTNDSVFVYPPENSDQVTCTVTSNASCVTGNPAISNTKTVTVTPQVPVVVTISPTANSVCEGALVTFNASVINGGSSPSYQWKVNGINAGSNSPVFTLIPANGDTVTCEVLSSATCVSGNPATSNPVGMIVFPLLQVSVTVDASAQTVCAGTEVTFTATAVNAGSAPFYQWKVNGIQVGGNSPVYAYIPLHNDQVVCTVTSSETCTTGNPATSQAVVMTVNPVLPVSATIAASGNPVCDGMLVTYTASVVNGGANPLFQWKINGTNVQGATNITYSYMPENGDQVSCEATSSIACPTGSPAQSNVIAMVVNPILPVSVTIDASETDVCAGSQVMFTATPVNGGTAPQYQWKVNGVNVTGGTGATYTYLPANGDQVACELNSSEACSSGNPALSNSIALTVHPVLPVSISIVATATDVCAGTTVTYTATLVNGGSSPSYLWKVNGMAVPGVTSPIYSYEPLNGDVVTCEGTSSEECTSGNPAISNSIDMIVNPLLPVSLTIGAPVLEVCAGTQVVFTANPVNGGTNPAYQWKVNGMDVMGGTNGMYAYAPANGDLVSCELTSSEACATGSPAPSNVVPMVVNPLLPVSVTIDATATEVCAGTEVTFTAAIVNGGTNPAYQWTVNGMNVTGGTNGTYSYIPANGDQVKCVLVSDAVCATGNPASSSTINMTVNPLLPVSVSIGASDTEVCEGTSVTFIATGVHGGPSPAYQWKVNGTDVPGGTNGSYSYVPVNGDQVLCVFTSSEPCATDNPAFSNTKAITVNPLLPVEVSIVASANPVCAGTQVTYTATGTNGGNLPVYQWMVNGIIRGSNLHEFTYIPVNNDQVLCVMTSGEECTTGNPAISNTVPMMVTPILPVSVTISATANPVCAGTDVTFSAIPLHGGTNPAFQWKVNGTDVPGETNNTFTYAPLNGDAVTCLLTSSEACTSGNPALSNAIPMTVNPLLPVSVTIEATATEVCAGTQVTFTATPVNEGTEPAWQWLVNGTNVPGATNGTYSYVPGDGDQVQCQVTSSETCVTDNPAMSNTIPVTVNPLNPVSITITASAETVCSGTEVIFSAIPVNGGTYPQYQWKVNGTNVAGATDASYAYFPANSDQVLCLLTSDIQCATGNPAQSNLISLTVLPQVTAGVTISANATEVCDGTQVMLTAVPVNGGPGPQFQWKVNGFYVPGATGATYAYGPAHGDQVACEMTSNAPCVNGSPAVSNTVTFTVNPVLPVSVTIDATDTDICAGTQVTFTATPVNGGTWPQYQWKINGMNVPGETNATYNYAPANGDDVACELTSNETCTSGNPALSNVIEMTVNPLMPVSITIVASANPVCEGTEVTYTATPVNGGNEPGYQWKVNGLNVDEAVTAIYSFVPDHNDVVSCVLTSTIGCATGNPATSNAVVMNVMPLLPVSVEVTASANPVCEGANVSYTAAITNGGTNPAYQWKVNGTDVPDATSATYEYTPANSDQVSCQGTSSALCTSGNPAISNTVVMTVSPPAPVSIVITESANQVCAGTQVTFTSVATNGGTSPAYQWKVNGSNIAGADEDVFTYAPSNGDVVTCSLTSSEPCATGNPALSNPVSMTVNPLLPVSITISASANPVCEGTQVCFTATPVNGGSGPAYQWFVNGNPVSGATGPGYCFIPANGDQVYCRLTSDATCPTGNPANSNTVVMTVNPLQPVSVSVAAAANPVCAGTQVCFTATPVNGGANPVYQWYVNSIVVPGVTGSTYCYIPVNNDQVTCSLSSDINCPSGNPAMSNTLTMTVNPLLPVSITIAASTNPVCAGTQVCFTSTPVNGGSTPTYQWYVNGNPASGATGTGYCYIPVNGDQVTCVLTSDINCPSGNPATSNTVTMTVNPLLPVSITIAASNNPVCAGTQVCFTATPVNGGSGPVYQWFVNGNPVSGATGTGYCYIPVNGDQVYCRLTSDATCPTGNPANSNVVTMTVNPLQPVSVSIAPAANPVCAGTQVCFTATPVNGGTNPVYQWYVNGNPVSGVTGASYCYVPVNNDQVSCSLTSDINCPSGNPAMSNTVTMNVNPLLPVSITISASANPVCAGTQVCFTATPVNGGSSPAFQWFVNGNPVSGATGTGYCYTPVNGDQVKCRLTSNINCPSGNPAESNTVTMTVNPLLPVSITIAVSNNPVCAGTQVCFTATPVNGGSSPAYQWFVNSNPVSGATGTSYCYVPVNADQVYCRLTSSETCATGNPANSNTVSMTVNPLLPVSVSISVSANPICAGSQVCFTATPVNGGDNPVYQWYVNGIVFPAYTGFTFCYTPVNSDQVRCSLISNINCPSGNPAMSNTLTMTVNPLMPVSITISASANPVCAGTQVCFTAIPVNGGSSPAYQWFVNGNPVSGATGSGYCYIPVNGDQVKCRLTSNINCPSGNPAESNVISMTVNPQLAVGITIAASANPVCAGTQVCFTATPVNGGSNPAYQWYVNGIPVSGATGATYCYIPVNSDQVYCVLTSNANCATGNPATSNVIPMTVNTLLPVSVSIAASANPVCAGTQVCFTATPVNGGSSPAYQWFVNGNPVSGATGATYCYVPANNDQVKCRLTSSITCPYGNPAESNTVTMTVNPLQPVSVTIAESANNVCAGTSVTFTATPVNGGTSPLYQWRVNGSNVTGATNITYTYPPTNGNQVSCVLTSNINCASGNPDTSNTVVMTVNPAQTVSVSIAASANPVCTGTSVTFTATPVNGGTSPQYQWRVDGAIVPGATNVTYNYIPVDGDSVTCVLTSNIACGINNPATSNIVPMTVNPNVPASVTIAPSTNPTCSGNSVTMTATPVNGGTSPTYEWYKNGTLVSGITGPTYSFIPANNDKVYTKMTSNASCVTGSPATSETDTLLVQSAVAVSVAIVASDYGVRPNTQVTFTATPTNGGSNPGYQWRVNGTPVTGATNSTYAYAPADHDKLTCVLSSSLTGCLTGNPATSNQVTMVVYTTGAYCAGDTSFTYAGHTYHTVQIGTQCWLRENLNVGTRIAGSTNQTNNGTIEKYCYGNIDENCNAYGGLYQWAELVQYLNGATNTTNWNPVPTGPVQGLCPTGWHIPTNAEWGTLMTTLGGIAVTGGKIKEATTAHFASPNTGATNSSGFTALPGGLRWSSGSFYYITNDANFWTVTSGGAATDVYYGGASYSINAATNGQFYKVSGLSVRCIKN